MPRVLVVDDDERLTRSIGRMLRGVFEVTATTSSAAAIEQLVAADLSGERFDVVLCDVWIAEHSYADVLRAVMRCRDPSLFVLMSGGDEPALSGADAFLEKPFALRDVLQTITSLMFARPHAVTKPMSPLLAS
ncbi:MAG TPA: response regulator [Kofleriaceae bacterium]|jgi:CheY-like chemotaxis protein